MMYLFQRVVENSVKTGRATQESADLLKATLDELSVEVERTVRKAENNVDSTTTRQSGNSIGY